MIRHRLLTAAIIISCLFTDGCAYSPPALTDSNRLRGPGLDEPFEDSSTANWPADPGRLATDIRRAFRELDWGRMYIRKDPAAADHGEVVRAAALLPDGRLATIIAWPATDDGVSVGVGLRVGRFGDRDREQQFVNMLAKLLAGKPAPVRGGSFALPCIRVAVRGESLVQ